MDKAIGLILALASPLLLWPVESIIPLPAIIEELYKGVISWKLRQEKIGWTIIAGIVLATSETVFYLVNFLALGNFENLPKRLLVTTVLHTSTMVISGMGARSNKFGWTISLLISMAVHSLFNLFVGYF
ncbi:hypothetical protein KBC75_00580 [Candidatus Shapirobacteria bacterium]|nr:hypothetical protein [Candidatus Shapirobacteria bacterium]